MQPKTIIEFSVSTNTVNHKMTLTNITLLRKRNDHNQTFKKFFSISAFHLIIFLFLKKKKMQTTGKKKNIAKLVYEGQKQLFNIPMLIA